MKKCPECGNPSYDGAPVCGNCGYKFPKPKAMIQKEENIFKESPKQVKKGNEPSTTDILKENKLAIGAIFIITLIVIGIIIATGPSGDNVTTQIDGANKYSDAGISFTYPSTWSETSGYDESHEGAVYFNASDAAVEYYNVTSDISSIYELNNQRVSYALESGFNIDTVQTLDSNGTYTSDIILEDGNSGFTRYVTILSGDKLYVFKIDANSLNNVKSSEIESVLQSVHIE